MLGLRVKQHWILTELDNQALIDALKVATAALGVDDPKLFHVLRTPRRTIRVNLPVTDLLVVSIEQTRLTQHDLVVAEIAEMVRRAVVGIGEEACLVDGTLNGAVDLLAHLSYLRFIVGLGVLVVELVRQCSLFNTWAVRIERPNTIARRLIPQQASHTTKDFGLAFLAVVVLATVFGVRDVAIVVN